MTNGKEVFGTTEWASKNVNYIQGCEHDCKYCYAKDMAIRFKRKSTDDWSTEVVNIKTLNKGWRKAKGTIMFPSTHDLTPANLNSSIVVLRKLLAARNNVLIVSKPHYDVIRVICDLFPNYKDQILFRFSIGSINSDTLKFWEPGAPDYDERKQCLIHAFENGYATSVSVEPMLDNNMEELIDDLSPIVTDSIWMGKMNRLFPRLKRNGIFDNETTVKAHELIAMQSDSEILKLYDQFKNNPLIKWKESIKKLVGIEVATESGLDS